MNERFDWFMRQHVDQGIDIAKRASTAAAAEFMFSKGVPLHVARRVLLK
jgi:hypothetical protein